MIDTPTLQNADDWRQRYSRTYGWFKPTEGSKKLVYIKDTGPRVVFSTPDGNEFFANLNQGVEFEFLPITRGWFYTRNGGANLLQRVPAKQYARGITKANTMVSRLKTDGTIGTDGTIDFTLLEDVFVSPPKYSWEQFFAGVSSCFIPSKFFLISRYGPVYMYDTFIGRWGRENNLIKLESPLFQQELSDALRRVGVTMEVTCG